MNMKRVFLIASLVVLLSISAFPAKASPGSIELIGKEWNHDPIKVYIHAPSQFQAYEDDVLTALNDWSSGLEDKSGNTVDNSEIGGTADGVFDFQIVDSRKDADIVIQVHGGAYAGVLGIAIPQDKDMDGYFDKVRITVKVGPGAGEEDFRNVVRHEIGHALGLGHADDPNDLMYPTYDASATNTDIMPSDLDLDALLYIYFDDGFGLPNLDPDDIPESYP